MAGFVASAVPGLNLIRWWEKVEESISMLGTILHPLMPGHFTRSVTAAPEMAEETPKMASASLRRWRHGLGSSEGHSRNYEALWVSSGVLWES